MEPEGSLPHSQVPANSLNPEPAQSCPYLQVLFLEDLLLWILCQIQKKITMALTPQKSHPTEYRSIQFVLTI
jgi:hypothetical protein